MSSLLAHLPGPRHVEPADAAPEQAPVQSTAISITGTFEPPPYLRRRNFVPRKAQDFGQGGAFPEIHVAQYPLEMGRPDAIRSSKGTLAVSMNADGTVAYDAIVKQGSNKNKTVFSDHGALLPKVDRHGTVERHTHCLAPVHTH
eukprot:1158352-Pelagomonas_calceolata.AAC.5